jgi:DNA-binding protein YbaB
MEIRRFKVEMAGMMKKAQKMQDNMQQAQDEITKHTATGNAGGGCIKFKCLNYLFPLLLRVDI